MYLFTSERLGFRNWRAEDLAAFAMMNADLEVMEHFPSTLTDEESSNLIKRLQERYEEYGYTYYACELLDTIELIGFIGLVYQDYESSFCPATDIGWRLKRSAWGKGYATEGAKRCLEYAFKDLKLQKVISTCTIGNTQSERVMQKLGMIKQGEFNHPDLILFPNYQKCLWYELTIKSYTKAITD